MRLSISMSTALIAVHIFSLSLLCWKFMKKMHYSMVQLQNGSLI